MKHTISILVENHAGVLSRVSGLFSRRGFNIDSLAVGVTDDPEVSRITIVADGDEHTAQQLESSSTSLLIPSRYALLSLRSFLQESFSSSRSAQLPLREARYSLSAR